MAGVVRGDSGGVDVDGDAGQCLNVVTGPSCQSSRRVEMNGSIRSMTPSRAALFVGRTTVAAAVRRPTAYSSGRMLLLLVLLGGLIGALIWLMLVAVATLVVEWPAFARADRIFSYGNGSARAVARVAVRAGVWRVSSVAARPQSHGGGTAVMAQIMTAADAAGATLELSPASAEVRDWYVRLGFVQDGRRLRRAPRSALPTPPPPTDMDQ